MDIHRCRFVPYPPSAINAVAFSYSHVTKAQGNKVPVRLAIGRANGDIEIWNPSNGIWHQEKILHGGKDRSIDGLVWVTEPDQVAGKEKVIGKSRLFSIGYTSTVTEWDLEKGRPKKQASGSHSDIWCLGTQPFVTTTKDGQTGVIQTGKKLVAGTMDGSLVLYSIDDDDLVFDRVLVKSSSRKTKMVSIAFQNRNIVVVGCSDSAIRVYDMRNGSMIRKMTLGSDLAGGAKEIIVWSVKCLNGRDIVSGDSTGQVCIWDGKTYTQAQRLQSHKQDVLSLATSVDGLTIVSGGMDRRTVLYRKTSGSRWSKVWHRRYHSHDVKTLASFEGLGISVVVSGGPDANPIVMPLREAGMENHRRLSQLPQSPPLQSAPGARLVVSWWDREVHIWRLRKPLRDIVNFNEVDSDVSKNRKLLARILVKGEANITSATISDDGSLLVVATTSDIKAFHLRSRDDVKRDELKISKVDVPPKIAALGATNLKMSPDGLWFCVIQESSKITLLRILQDADADSKPAIHPRPAKLKRLERGVPKRIAFGGLGHYDRSITQVTFSPDTKMLAVADMAGYIDTWVLRNSEHTLQEGTDAQPEDDATSSSGESDSSADSSDMTDSNSFGLVWTPNPNGSLVPKLYDAPTILSFSSHIPAGTSPATRNDVEDKVDDYVLLTVTAKQQVLTLHPTVGRLTPWSRRNPVARFPAEFRNIRDLVKGALWSGTRVWLYGTSFLLMIDTSLDIAGNDPTDPSSAMVSVNGRPGQKRKRGVDTGAGNRMEIGTAGPRRVERHVEGEAAQEIDFDLPAPDPMDTDEPSQPEDESESEDSEDERRGELALRRQREGPQGYKGHAIGFWHTYKYRPILGIVRLEGVKDEQANEDDAASYLNGQGKQSLEVALVERPLWEVDMAERYVAEVESER
ncbi:WD40-repeat-containing domain protein [Pseudomassariella vexata]|uniref:WD40-repeat-containing domain protein n=1 Tax=Pseudomassariella vexata TaxID=1141098 RepID=A0A1Y2EF37_9PEZI|nr:WD40-repeat-containing domain protein [Pseudomassariella vexata]ORY70193.1 WD40-repeat-containing domain protein [Pseudomassariella vexata]